LLSSVAFDGCFFLVFFLFFSSFLHINAKKAGG
jgi:hypothetical protein